MSDETTPLRWCHFREGPEGPGVYVHLADLLALLDAVGSIHAKAELEALLDERVRVATEGQGQR